MLTRLRVTGFKNLVDVDVRFGPFTCVAGANAVGKSNLFDAIRFLSALSELPLIEAASRVRDEAGRSTDVRNLFHCVGTQHAQRMSFEAEMIVPATGRDDLGELAESTTSFLRYGLELGYRIEADDGPHPLGRLEILEERLEHIKLGDAAAHLRFPHTVAWRKSAVAGRRSGGPFISTDGDEPNRVIKLHMDGSGGRPRAFNAKTLPRTVISNTNAHESPTALLARREMQSWRLLQLEPQAMRASDRFTDPASIGADGAHLAATLARLARSSGGNGANGRNGAVYSQVANRLAELIEDVHGVSIERDDRTELLTLQIFGRDGTVHAARALSDGTLRFLALVTLGQDPEAGGVLCLEEPENGISPRRIPAMLELLSDLALDPNVPVSPDNPLRQVIINTHSSAVVQQVPDGSLLVAELIDHAQPGESGQIVPYRTAVFRWLSDTWRAKADVSTPPVARGRLLEYLNPVLAEEVAEAGKDGDQAEAASPRAPALPRSPRRVIDRPDLQLLLPGLPSHDRR